MASITGTATVVGAHWATDQARKTFASAARREAIDQAGQLRTASQVAAAMGDMKGALMKLGQMASFIDPGMPPVLRAALANLQDGAPPMAPELASGVVTRELGASPQEVFAEWDDRPIAAASIGQVHRAMTHDGRAVAVKVQYPGVDDAIRADLTAATALVAPMRSLFPGVDARVVIDEISEHVLEELDYRREARNQLEFAAAYAGHPSIIVPAVDLGLSTGRVLTTELSDGAPFAVARSWPAETRDRIGETIYRFIFGSLHRLHRFNGDPHPGNYLVHRDGRVTFVDFGMVKRLTPAMFAPFEDMARTMVTDRDLPAFRRVLEGVGYLEPDADLTDAQIEAYFSHFYEWVREDRPFTMTSEYANESVRRFFNPSAAEAHVLRSVSLPRDMVIIQRINLGVHAVLAELGATGNWHRFSGEIWPWANVEPTTEIGRAEGAWLRSRAAARSKGHP